MGKEGLPRGLKYLTLLLRIAFGAVFLYTGYIKVVDIDSFVRILGNYRIFPSESVILIAFFIAWFELVVGFCLLTGIFKRGAILLLNLALFLFMMAILSAVLRGIDTSCGCFTLSPEKEKVSLMRAGEDFAMLLLALYLFVMSLREN